MEFRLVFTAVAVLIIMFPHIRWFSKRLILKNKIKKLCIRNSYIIHSTHKLWFLGSKSSKNCDFYIETENQIFSVKLFGVLRRNSYLIFKEEGGYFIRGLLALVSRGWAHILPFEGKLKQLPVYNFKYKYKNEWDNKSIRQILLVNPVPMDFRYQTKHGCEINISAGEFIKGMEINSLSNFLKVLK